MANLYGRLQGSRGETTRLGGKTITAKLETWNGAIRVTLHADGSFSVDIGDKHDPRHLVLTGNVDTRTIDAVDPTVAISDYSTVSA